MSRQQVRFPPGASLLFSIPRFLFGIGQAKLMFKLLKTELKRSKPNAFKDYIPTEQDVFVATLERSGTNWMMQIALQIAHHGGAEYDYLYDMVSWPDFMQSVSLGLNEKAPESPSGLRIIKTHLEAPYVPFNDAAKYICVVRDPKEWLVSTYYFVPQTIVGYLGLKSDSISIDEWYQWYLAGDLPLSSWAEHTAGWWALRDKPNVMLIPYNSLKSDLEGQIDKIAEFLAVTLNADERAKVIEKASFDYMKQINHKFSPLLPDMPPIQVVRKGKADGGSELSAEQRAGIDSHCKQGLKDFNSDFPYDEFFA